MMRLAGTGAASYAGVLPGTIRPVVHKERLGTSHCLVYLESDWPKIWVSISARVVTIISTVEMDAMVGSI